MTTKSSIGVPSCADAAGETLTPAAPKSRTATTDWHFSVNGGTSSSPAGVEGDEDRQPHSHAQHDAAVAGASLPGAASAPIPEDVIDLPSEDALLLVMADQTEASKTMARAILGGAIMAARAEQREADARQADEHAQILRQNFDRSRAIAVEGVATAIRKGV